MTCKKCGRTGLGTEDFYGKSTKCKDCAKAYSRDYWKQKGRLKDVTRTYCPECGLDGREFHRNTTYCKECTSKRNKQAYMGRKSSKLKGLHELMNKTGDRELYMRYARMVEEELVRCGGL
ncbi:MAG: hypothetical protein V3R78_10080 [Thermodesulfobacteriota bacterium]